MELFVARRISRRTFLSWYIWSILLHTACWYVPSRQGRACCSRETWMGCVARRIPVVPPQTGRDFLNWHPRAFCCTSHLVVPSTFGTIAIYLRVIITLTSEKKIRIHRLCLKFLNRRARVLTSHGRENKLHFTNNLVYFRVFVPCLLIIFTSISNIQKLIYKYNI